MDLIYLSIIVAGILFSSFGFFEKYYLFNYTNSFNVILFRNISISLILLTYTMFLYLYNKKNIIKLKNKNDNFKIIFFIYCIIYFLTIFTIFNAFEKRKASKVSLISQLSMIIGSSLIGYFIFKENLTKINLLGILFSIIGLFFIMY